MELQYIQALRSQLEKITTDVVFLNSEHGEAKFLVNDKMTIITIYLDNEIGIQSEIDFPTDWIVQTENELYKANENIKLNEIEMEMEKMENINNVVVAMENEGIVKVLKNGVVKYALEQENDFYVVDEILSMASCTENYDGETVFNDRISNNVEGTYKVKIERESDYKNLVNMIQNNIQCETEMERGRIRSLYYDNKITEEEYHAQTEPLVDKTMSGTCDCKACKFTMPTFEEWKSGKLESGQKLGKYLRKYVSQSIVDFYSAQIKTEQEIFLTISGLAHHVAGMSNFASEGTWDGYGGTSCQDTRHDGEYAKHLIGSLHDNKLFVAMLHNELEDIEDMQDNLLARTLLRPFTIDGELAFLPLKYYGNNGTKDMLHNALNKLNEVDVYSNDIHKGDRDKLVSITENGNTTYYTTDYIDVFVSIDFDEEIEVDCPVCDRDNEVSAYDHNDVEHYFKCPCCGGTGTTYTNFYFTHEEYETIEDDIEITTYVDSDNGYYVYSSRYGMTTNVDSIRKIREQYTEVLEG